MPVIRTAYFTDASIRAVNMVVSFNGAVFTSTIADRIIPAIEDMTS